MRQPRKIEGETKMKAKTSRGIVTKLICCMALVVLSSVAAFSQATTVTITDVAVSAANATYTYNSVTATGPALQVGKSIQITGMTPAGNNGTFTITATTSTSFTVVNAAAVAASSQAGTGIEFNVTSGALLTINNSTNTSALLKIYDSQIHSSTNTSTTHVSTVQVVPVGSGGSACNPADQIPTDAYVLQGGSPTGCDPSDPFEVTDNNNFNTAHQVFGKADLSNFHIETHYKMNTSV